MASYIISYNVFQIDVTRHYRVQEFREGGFCDHIHNYTMAPCSKETCPCDVTQRGNGAWILATFIYHLVLLLLKLYC